MCGRLSGPAGAPSVSREGGRRGRTYLRSRFGLDAAEYTERTCIIVVEIEGEAREILIGIVVDAVSEVLNIRGSDIEDTPAFGTKLDTEYILGMAKFEGNVKILLDIDRVLKTEEIVLMKNIG